MLFISTPPRKNSKIKQIRKLLEKSHCRSMANSPVFQRDKNTSTTVSGRFAKRTWDNYKSCAVIHAHLNDELKLQTCLLSSCL